MIVVLPDQVTGYLDEGQVMLTCEIHGFLRSTAPPMWLNNNSIPIDSSYPMKYMVNLSTSTSQVHLLNSNGNIVPSLRSTLTIKQLEEGDEGQYTCMVEGNSSVVMLFIQKENITTPNPTISCKFVE